MADLTVLKQMLGWDTGDNTQNALLQAIRDLIEAQLRNRLGGADSIPEELDYIVTNCTLARFNQIGSEGLSSHSVADETQSWLPDIFGPYEDDIQAYLDRENQTSGGIHIQFF